METFDFYLDQKVTTWYRTPFEIQANTLEEAKELAIQFVKDDNHSNIPWDHIDGAIENMSVEENGGFATDELFCNDDVNLIWSNSTNEEQITTYGTK